MKNVIEISAHRRLKNQPHILQDTMHQSTQSITVYRSEALRVVDGANLGDTLSFADDLMLDDIYEVGHAASLQRLSLHLAEHTAERVGGFTIAEDTTVGQSGHRLHLDACIILMSPDGKTTEVILLVEVDSAGNAAEVYALPLAPLAPKTAYALVGIDTETPQEKFAQTACVSFARGTHITLSSGTQRKIEDLAVGDKVLTRDDGVQTIRWIGQNTLRAVGDYASVVLAAGTLNNTNDLVLRPDHRLFVYQRSDELGAGRAELLVKARHLLNGDTVVQREGGFIDYFQLLFDAHQIIYAEGIAAETTLINTRTRPAIPKGIAEMLTSGFSGDRHAASGRLHQSLEVPETLLNQPDTVEILRRASTR